jgi:hypothetical protein
MAPSSAAGKSDVPVAVDGEHAAALAIGFSNQVAMRRYRADAAAAMEIENGLILWRIAGDIHSPSTPPAETCSHVTGAVLSPKAASQSLRIWATVVSRFQLL